jgi:hypothetical protein
MFKRLAKFRQFEPRHLVPHRPVPVHSNDNQPGRRRSAGRQWSPQPALSCHWALNDESRLECRWNVARVDEPRRCATLRQATVPMGAKT